MAGDVLHFLPVMSLSHLNGMVVTSSMAQFAESKEKKIAHFSCFSNSVLME